LGETIKDLLKRPFSDYEGILNSLEEGVVVLNKDYTIAFGNDFYTRLVKKHRGRILGRHCYEVFRGLSSICPECAAKTTFETGKSASITHSGTSRDGSTVWVEMNTHPIFNHGGAVARVIETVKDITERKKLEEKLRESEGRYRTLVETMNDGLWAVNEKGETTYWNRRMGEILGYDPKEVIGRHVFSFLDEENQEKVKRELAKRPKGEASTYEAEVITKTGKKVPLMVSATPLFDDKGKHIGSFAVVRDISEKKRYEAELKEYSLKLEEVVNQRTMELKESEEKYRSLVNNAPVGIYRSTLNGKLLMANPRLLEILGYTTEEEMKAVNVREHYADPKRRQELLDILKGKGEVRDFESEMKRKDGKHIFVNLSAKLFMDKEGKAYLEGIINDVTEKKWSRSRLLAMYKLGQSITSSLSLKSILTQVVERMSSMLDCTNCFILLLDERREKLECVAASENVRKTIGKLVIDMEDVSLAGETVKLRSPIAVEDAEKNRIVNPKLRKRFGHKSFLSVPLIVKDKVLGAVILGETRRTRKFSVDEVELASALASSAAVAIENARLYEEIEKTKDFLNSIIESSADSIITTDLDGKIISFSRGAEQLFGYKARDMLGKSVLELYPEALRKQRMKWVERLTKGETLRNIKTRLYNSNGELVHISLSLSLLKDAKGLAIGTVGIAKDITAEVEAREHLKEAYRRLKELHRMKDELIANVSHELRTPITITKTAMELALDESDAEKRRKLLTMGVNAMKRQDYIVGDLIGFQKMQKGEYELRMESFDLGHMGMIVAEEIRSKAKAKKMRIKVKVEENLPLVTADFNEIKHVLMNLIDNAVKFNKVGGQVLIEAWKKGEFVMCSVADTGIGIPKEHQKRIFEKFYQVDSGLERHYSGTGMGLAIVKSIIAAHGGKIRVESEVGKGSKFTFSLPLKQK
jgi:PAS domain S-box-containing protein